MTASPSAIGRQCIRSCSRVLLAVAAPVLVSFAPAIASAQTVTVKRPDRDPGNTIQTLINGEPVAVMVPLLEGGIIPIRNPRHNTTIDADGDGLDLYREALLFSHPADVDSDDDGLDDGVEVFGTADVDYPGLGANPARRDVFVEIDYEHFERDGRTWSARLPPAADRKLKELYGTLPIMNPNGSQGLDPHLVYDQKLPDGTDCGQNYANHPDFNPKHHNGFRYARLCVKECAPGTTCSALAGQANGRRFFTTITPNNTNPDDDENEYAVFLQYAVFAHEFGHSGGLWHGGFEEKLNEKPNYPSLMNYAYDYDFAGSPKTLAGTRIGFSEGQLPPIDQNAVPEVNWGPPGVDLSFLRSYDNHSWNVSGSSVDWSNDGVFAGNFSGSVRWRQITVEDDEGNPMTVIENVPVDPARPIFEDNDDAAYMRDNLSQRIPGESLSAGDSLRKRQRFLEPSNETVCYPE